MPKPRAQRALTIVELLIVIAVVGVLVSLLIPAVQAAREAVRRSQCQNNLKQIGLALVAHADAKGALPVGSANHEASPPGTAFSFSRFGFSWWVEILPYLDEQNMASKLERTGTTAVGGIGFGHARNYRAADGFAPKVWFCPSSSVPRFEQIGLTSISCPSYVGISGATDDYGFAEDRLSSCCAPVIDGQISAGGVLVPNQAIALKDVTDGLSKTIAVGEASRFAINFMGKQERVDGSFPLGWLAGTTARGTPPDYQSNNGQQNGAWGITTIRYAPNENDYGLPGIENERGANNPLISAHPNGVNTVRLDGSVRWQNNATELLILMALATRDDGS